MDLIKDFKLIKTGFGKKIDEVEEDHDDCHINWTSRTENKIEGQESLLDFVELYLTEGIIIYVVNNINWYAKQY